MGWLERLSPIRWLLGSKPLDGVDRSHDDADRSLDNAGRSQDDNADRSQDDAGRSQDGSKDGADGSQDGADGSQDGADRSEDGADRSEDPKTAGSSIGGSTGISRGFSLQNGSTPPQDGARSQDGGDRSQDGAPPLDDAAAPPLDGVSLTNSAAPKKGQSCWSCCGCWNWFRSMLSEPSIRVGQMIEFRHDSQNYVAEITEIKTRSNSTRKFNSCRVKYISPDEEEDSLELDGENMDWENHKHQTKGINQYFKWHSKPGGILCIFKRFGNTAIDGIVLTITWLFIIGLLSLVGYVGWSLYT